MGASHRDRLVFYEQRVSGEPTGLYFRVPRWRHWLVRALVRSRRLPLVGRCAAFWLARMKVVYKMKVTYSGPRALA